jgi:hypothetical protein
MSVPTERLVFSFIEFALESCGQASPMTRLWRAEEPLGTARDASYMRV